MIAYSETGGFTHAQGCGYDTAATPRSVTCKNGDSDESPHEQQIKHDAEEREEHDTTQEKGENDGETSVDGCCSCNTRDSPHPYWNVDIVLSESTDVIGKGAEHEK